MTLENFTISVFIVLHFHLLQLEGTPTDIIKKNKEFQIIIYKHGKSSATTRLSVLTILELQPSETKLNFSASEAVGRASPLLFSGIVHILL